MFNAESAEYDFPVRQAVQCVRSFAEVMAEEIAAHAPTDLVAPDYEDYRLSVPTPGSVMITTDLRIAKGVFLPVEGRLFSDDGPRNLKHIRSGLRALLKTIFEDISVWMKQQSQVEQEARRMMAAANQLGLEAHILKVDFAPVFLNAQNAQPMMEIVVEGATCNMLRPCRMSYRVGSSAELTRVFDELEAELTPVRRERRLAAAAVGAVGYIDSVALAVMDALPDGREVTLAKLARQIELRVWLDLGDSQPQAHSFRWYDGVVRAYAPLSPTCYREWDIIDVEQTSPSMTSQPASVLCGHPALANLTIEEVIDTREVRVSDVLLPFSADGQVLTDD